MDTELIAITLLGVSSIGLPAFFLRRKYFFKYIIFNFFTFVFIYYIFDAYTAKLVWYFPEIHWHILLITRQILPIAYTPIYCYFLTDYEKPNSNSKKSFNIISILVILCVIYKINTVNLIYPYFILSLVVFVFLKKENILKKAGQATTIALGLYCLFEPYYVSYFNSFYYAFSGYLQSFLDIRVSLFQHDISVLEIMMYCLLLLYIIIAIILVALFSNCVSVKKTHDG